MSKRKRTKHVHEGKYVMEVEVELFEGEDGWSPYLSLQAAYRLDDVREALRAGDLKTAAKYGKVFYAVSVRRLAPLRSGFLQANPRELALAVG